MLSSRVGDIATKGESSTAWTSGKEASTSLIAPCFEIYTALHPDFSHVFISTDCPPSDAISRGDQTASRLTALVLDPASLRSVARRLHLHFVQIAAGLLRS
jgi:hypothetical protein